MPTEHAPANDVLLDLLDTVGIGIWEYDHRSDRLVFSDRLKAALGGDFPAPGGSSMADWLDRIHPEDRAKVVEAVTASLTTDATFDTEYRFRKGDGNWVWLHVRGRVVERDSEGRPLRSLGAKTEVTLRKQEEALLHLQQRFNQAMAETPERDHLIEAVLDTVLGLTELDAAGLYWRAPDGGYLLTASRGFSEDFLARSAEYGPDTLQAGPIPAGKLTYSCAESCPDCTSRNLIQQPFLAREGITTLVVLPILLHGEPTASLYLASRHAGTLPAHTVRFLDNLALQFGQALERQQAWQEAGMQRDNLEGFFAAIQDYVFVLDMEGTIVHVNPAVHDKLGYGDELIGRSVLAVHPPRVHDEAMRVTAEMLAGSLAHCPLPLLNRNGDEIMVDTRVVKGTWNGQPALLGLSRDITALIRTQSELEQERALLKTLIGTIPDQVWLKDPDGAYLACNPRFESLYGHKEADILGRTDYDFVDRDLADAFRANDRAAVAAGGPRRNEEWVTFAADGYRGLFETTKTPMYDGQGRLIGVLGIAHDITHVRAAESALREADERRRMLMEVSRDGIAIIDQEHRVIEANRRFAEMLGYTPEEVIGLHTWDWEADLSETEIRAAFADLSTINTTFETRHLRKDGTVYTAEVSASGTRVGDAKDR
ncbi:MAG: PAS domain S-box protein, partial [Thiobacillus sp.]|nr:PAS domain S-box protein [Thiobacillus sp.]